MIKDPGTTPSFRGDWWFLSCFYPSPVRAGGKTWPSAEHLFQAMRVTDPRTRERFRACKTPKQAKWLSHHVETRPDWNNIRLDAMRFALARKFENPNLRELLRRTHPQPLVERNTWNDTFWGTCNGKGENHLGRILMEIREQAQTEKENQP